MMDGRGPKIQADIGGQGGGGDSIWPKVLKITGIGCAVLIVIGIILASIGVFRAATCCNQLQDIGEVADAVESQSYEFATHLGDSEFEKAHGLLDETTRQDVTVEEFSEQLAGSQRFLELSDPFPIIYDMERDEDFDLGNLAEASVWMARTWFVPPRGDGEFLELQMTLVMERDGEEFVRQGIEDWNLQVYSGGFEDTPFVSSARRFHEALIDGRVGRASEHLAPNGEFSWMDREALGEELAPYLEALSEMSEGQMWGIYPEDQKRFVVRYLVRDQQGAPFMIDYTVVAAEEGIAAVSEVRPATEVEPEFEDPADDEKAANEEAADEEVANEEAADEEAADEEAADEEAADDEG